MRVNWTDKFLNIAESNGLDCYVSHKEHGWLETLIINGQRCYSKSKTYDHIKREYYIGVDPKKLKEKGDLILICGGDSGGQFRDIFLIPWIIFFRDRKLFEKEYPGLKIVKLKPHTPFRYLLSGGFSYRQLLPSFTYKWMANLELLLSPFNKFIGMFYTIELAKR